MSMVMRKDASGATPSAGHAARQVRLNPKFLPLAATVALFLLMAGYGAVTYTGFFSAQVFLNLFIDNAFLIVVAVGMTFVILSGGIDLSVGSVIALTTMVSASLVEKHGWPPLAVMPLVLLMGTAFGTAMGWLIERFRLQPFIVTLAGMFLARGLCYVISIDSISITHPIYAAMSQFRIPVWGEATISLSGVIAIGVITNGVITTMSSRRTTRREQRSLRRAGTWSVTPSEELTNWPGRPTRRYPRDHQRTNEPEVRWPGTWVP